jgi:ATP-binding cassette, subfamily C, type I secretion system permease/ATPase
VAGGLGAISKVLRLALQSGVLGLGAYLVIQQQATAGIIIASSIIVARALAPVELAIANWRGFVAGRQSWRRLSDFLDAMDKGAAPMALPAPKTNLVVESVVGVPPSVQRVVVQDVSFALKAGQGLGVIGPSGSGKSSLARLLVGVWTPARGKVRIDGAALDQWSPAELGQHIGYLPQDVELFAGTVKQNISRFEPNAPSETVIAASQAAGVHDMIVRLPEGYDTQVGDGGTVLSAGQRQRIALARALYRDPFLIVLDEPNSNLDAEGDKALTQAIMRVRARSGIVVVVAHRPSALAGVDQVLAMLNGRPAALGPRDEVLAKLFGPPAQAAPAAGAPAAAAGGVLRLVGEAGGATS